MDINWCLVCEKHTASRGAYCSELCRRVDVARSLRTPDASPAAQASRPSHSHIPTLHLSPFPSTSNPSSFPSPPVTPTTSLFPSRKSSFTMTSNSNTPLPSPRTSPCMPPNHSSNCGSGSSSLAIPVLSLGSAAIPMVHSSSFSHSGSKSMASSPVQHLSPSDPLSRNHSAFTAPLLLR